MNGEVAHSGRTPETVTLWASSGYYQKGHYTITFSKDGYSDEVVEISPKVDVYFYIFGFFNFITAPLEGRIYSYKHLEETRGSVNGTLKPSTSMDWNIEGERSSPRFGFQEDMPNELQDVTIKVEGMKLRK